jgi:hypothetical protein
VVRDAGGGNACDASHVRTLTAMCRPVKK